MHTHLLMVLIPEQLVFLLFTIVVCVVLLRSLPVGAPLVMVVWSDRCAAV